MNYVSHVRFFRSPEGGGLPNFDNMLRIVRADMTYVHKFRFNLRRTTIAQIKYTCRDLHYYRLMYLRSKGGRCNNTYEYIYTREEDDYNDKCAEDERNL